MTNGLIICNTLYNTGLILGIFKATCKSDYLHEKNPLSLLNEISQRKQWGIPDYQTTTDGTMLDKNLFKLKASASKYTDDHVLSK